MAWLILAAYSILALLFSSQVALDYAYARRPIAFSKALAIAAADWYVWAALTPLVAWLARRFRIERGTWLRSLAVHLPVSLACTFGKMALDGVTSAAIAGATRAPTSFMKVHVTFLTYWIIVGATYAIGHYHRAQERQLRAAQLEAALARAQVQALRVQIQPHFLFNTLNAVAALIREDVEAADAMIARLAELLRATLATADAAEVPLRRELELAQMYLDIQQARIGDRLTVAIECDEEVADAPVPTLLLQPLVENAVRHGAAARTGPVRIAVRARRENGMLAIDVEDDGPGPPQGFSPASGQGLENTRARLAAAYGGAASFELSRGSQGGALARVRVPL